MSEKETIDQELREQTIVIPDELPAMALKDAVLFPFVMVPLSVGRDRSVAAVDQALAESRLLLLLSQRDPSLENPSAADLYNVGTVAGILRMIKLPDGHVRILVQGLARARIDFFTQEEPYFRAHITRLEEPSMPSGDLEVEAFVRTLRTNLEKVVELGKSISPEVMLIAGSLADGGRLADLVASNLTLRPDETQKVLEATNLKERMRIVNEMLEHELALLEVQREISTQVQGEVDRNQREYLLRQQLRQIQKELGETDDMDQEVARYRELVDNKPLSAEAKTEADKQLKRLRTMHGESAEAAVIRTYLDWLVGLPWQSFSEDNLDLAHGRQVLDEDHYDLEKIKQRIVEFLAVRKLKADSRGPILCFVGPPGVGKTSLGRSIARALGRKFVRLSLGGVHDEAEIRGHRRTYVGAMPGRIIQGINQAGTANPVFMLDEIDKIGADYRGDPSAALLEVLDPEQNFSFRDHYLDVAFDLSTVMFIATANVTETIHPAFLDRMEVIRLSGYTEEEKLHIARRYLIPKQVAENGLPSQRVRFTERGLRFLINRYTREAGLRNLEREIGALCRKVAVAVAEGSTRRHTVTPRLIEKHLGPVRFLPEEQLVQDRVGVATGLAWTPVGGDILHVEALALPGKGELILTGHLGEVMKESAQAALSFLRASSAALGIPASAFTERGFHVHVPAGATPKDGPSAGVTLLCALASAASGRAVRRDLAMTGEITLRGQVLPVGGIKEKVLAALQAGITEVVLPIQNRRDLAELSPELRTKVRPTFVEQAHEVLALALRPSEAQEPGEPA
ncbi:MAG: endopeptidase La [Thermoanaerobaculaceae bacterium]|nr:endopeptidase La [Thermoanaerobaculaceae bacterium]MDI9621152.1 endopeptidase La [Acidobacteriota bacterium]NLH10717.1 endopeptidase La [Holophagae bacterium]HPW55675.1 endopeptidase La [Thermoanaerobaculaceae bacterium]